MKKVVLFSALATIGFISLAFQSRPAAWTVNTETASVAWELPYEPSPEGGTIAGIQAEINFDDADLANSHIKASVDVNTFTASNKLKAKHLKDGKNKLDSNNFPQITFESTGFQVIGPQFEAQGIVNFRGQEFEVTIPFSFEKEGDTGTFTGSWEMNTEEMGIDLSMKSLKSGEVQNNLRITFSLPVEP